MDNYKSQNIKLITNNYKKGHKVLTSLIKQLRDCDSFVFSVAFITNSGLASIIHELEESRKLNKRGTIITTDYLAFNEPSVLRRIMLFENIDLRVIDQHNFHVKGYIFKQSNHNEYIIGSSNLTQEALTTNLEWNLHFNGYSNEEVVEEIEQEISHLLAISKKIDEAWLLDYEQRVKKVEKSLKVTKSTKPLIPNSLQIKGLHALQLQRELKHNKALVISATGTGKTYLAAFDARKVDPKRLLFVVHREQIAKKSLESFMHVFQDEKTYGMYTGNQQEMNADFLFATVQTISKEEHHMKFDPDTFDYIVYDEAHHIGAHSYQKILNYFTPKFTLAMTATPEKNDNNNIYEYMDHNIAFEIRLNEALKEKMLAPFHYYGISDLIVDGELIDDQTQFNRLVSHQRVEHIINKCNLYGFCGARVKGLMFCSRVEEAELLSIELNKHGYNTIALSGSNTQEEREEAIERLTSDYHARPIDYILTVDIFNEGVDIPEINQVVMLRPTQSAIVFVQQLGRGLRKRPDKDYVVIIDFIGNYKNNFFIPIALSGDKTLDKETLYKFVKKGNHTLPGESTIHFDDIVEEKILRSVKQTNFATKKFLKEAYDDLKFKLNKIPRLLDFYEIGSVDPRIIMQYKPSYYDFLKVIDSDYTTTITYIQNQILTFLSKEILYNKRKDEVLILEAIINNEIVYYDQFVNENNTSFQTINHAVQVLSLKFFKNADQQKYGGMSLVDNDNQTIMISSQFKELLEDQAYKRLVLDLIATSKAIIENEYNESVDDPFILYKKYTRKDVCKLLEWEKDVSSTMYGYTVRETATPIFVTYNKDEGHGKSTMYEDEIIDKERFKWYTRNRLNLNSKEVIMMRDHHKTNMRLDLFIKKDKQETDFFYVGKVIPDTFTPEVMKNDEGKTLSVVRVDMRFEEELHDDMMDYFVE